MKQYLMFLLVIALFALSCEGTKEKKLATLPVHVDENLILDNLNTYIDSCWNQHDTTVLSRISIEKFTRNLNGIEVAGTKKEMQAHINVFITAFPDMQLSIEKFLIKDNTAFLQWSSEGTNTGIFGEVAATGKKVQIQGLSQIYFNNAGKIYGEDVMYNELNLLQQLGYTLNPPVVK